MYDENERGDTEKQSNEIKIVIIKKFEIRKKNEIGNGTLC